MTEDTKKTKGGGSKLSRSEITTVRLDPKLRYLAEIAARKQRRTLSSFIEWAIEDSLKRFPIQEWDDGEVILMSRAEQLWDVDEADRLVKLALYFPDLLTHDEQVIWKLIRENGAVWRGRYRKIDGVWEWTVQESSMVFPVLRKYWPAFKAVALDGASPEILPEWERKDPDNAPF
ncbi:MULTISPECIES: YlcI/YnfO family protein [Comamonas]|uniref:CopG family transcriptional regulator n=1 Tax=Comamonas squillarum TaxID=2977320 RepID=A0ABY5ZYK9_9BURK|nr:hypothetical protein [Comamonas sp. PR12]UXC18528.1 hypothetical protein N4T19_23080 [Comamonas sp. PR12]